MAGALALSLVGVLALPAHADTDDSAASVMLEVDPIPFALSGHAAHVRVSSKRLPGWIMSFGIYGLEIPGFLTDVNSKNRDEGWNAEIRNAYAVFADYHFSGRPSGLFVGTQVAYQKFGLSRDGSVESRDFGVLMGMVRVGTLWKPFKSNFYVLPWAGIAANLELGDNDLMLGGEEYDVAPIGGFVTLHLGWQL